MDHRSGSHWAEPVSALGQERRKTEAQGGETPARACWQAKETESASLGGAGPVLTVGTKVQIRGCMYCAGTHPRLPGTKLRKRQMNPDALAGRHRPGWCRDECGRFNCCLAESGPRAPTPSAAPVARATALRGSGARGLGTRKPDAPGLHARPGKPLHPRHSATRGKLACGRPEIPRQPTPRPPTRATLISGNRRPYRGAGPEAGPGGCRPSAGGPTGPRLGTRCRLPETLGPGFLRLPLSSSEAKEQGQ